MQVCAERLVQHVAHYDICSVSLFLILCLKAGYISASSYNPNNPMIETPFQLCSKGTYFIYQLKT